MKCKEQILKFLKNELPYLKENFKVKSIGLFGSYAREEETETSYIDMLVEFEAPGFIKFMELENYLGDKLGAKVDLVTPDALKPVIKPQIIAEAVMPKKRNTDLFFADTPEEKIREEFIKKVEEAERRVKEGKFSKYTVEEFEKRFF